MNTTQITDALTQLFHSDNHRIIFWDDPDREFFDMVSTLSLPGVTAINLENTGCLELKVRLECDDPSGKFLLYSPLPEPAPENDWLLDIRLYSRTFHADQAAMQLAELGLTHQAMREHLKVRKDFLRSRERVSRLKKLVRPSDLEKDLDLKMLAALTRADQGVLFDILMKLFAEMAEQEDFRTPVKSWVEIEKFGLAPFFWEQVTLAFGYTSETPNLTDLLIRLLIGDLASTLHGTLPQGLRHFQLGDSGPAVNASVFTAQWRSHLAHYLRYQILSNAVARELKLEEHLSGFNEHELMDVMTFEAAERQVIRSLRSKIMQDSIEDPDDLKQTILRRRDGHWATVRLEEYGEGANIYAVTYNGLDAAIDLFSLRRAHDGGLSYPDATTMYRAYEQELFRFDQLYRTFHEAADKVELAGWDLLKEAQKKVEDCYGGWYLNEISTSWGQFMQGGDGLLEQWRIDNVVNQHRFFDIRVQPVLKSGPRSKVFVIISDALRYEVAEELTREINGKYRFKATLFSQLGVLPSYTALGMAALLPHQEYGYREGSDQVLVDGRPCSSLEDRNRILAGYEGMAVRAEELLAMNRGEVRELIRDSRVIYIYHDRIDSTGDTQSSETRTFSAARQTIEELSGLLRFIVNGLNGTNILVTADHGFLYQDTPPTELEKSGLGHKPENVFKAKKRYLLGKDLESPRKVWKGETRVTAGTTGNMEFWIPRGINRFHFAGGARFIHGGAMPQEVVVPIIQVKELHGETARKQAVKQVNVSLLGSNRKIVNSIQKFEFIQTEKVTERMLPRVLAVSIRDDDTLISNEETVTFDSTSDSMEDRKRSVKMRIAKGGYDNRKEYGLVLRDPETQIEYERIPVTIDLAFMNDF